MADMFAQRAKELAAERAPLAERLRPLAPADLAGQEHLTGPGGALHAALSGAAPVRNMILWGPPGTGKTTLARMLALASSEHFETLSATNAGVKDVRALIERARARLGGEAKGTIVFIDEIHRFNKSQQDSLLHASEDGLITLIGATTENPGFEVNSALLSRCPVHVLRPLGPEALETLIDRALADDCGLRLEGLEVEPEARAALIRYSSGDARRLLSALESAADLLGSRPKRARRIDAELLEKALAERLLRYDRVGDEHYDLASAMIKSVRGSDPDAAIYYAMRMLMGGEEPKFVVRRLAILASEDIGNADPDALSLAASAIQVVNFIGLPEAEYTICQLAAYLALAPKSNAAALARGAIRKVIEQTGELPVPLKIRNAPTRLAKDLGHGQDYHYAHNYEDGFYPEGLLPERIAGTEFYQPTDRGYEKQLKARLEELKRRIRKAKE